MKEFKKLHLTSINNKQKSTHINWNWTDIRNTPKIRHMKAID